MGLAVGNFGNTGPVIQYLMVAISLALSADGRPARDRDP
jgi:hypothetical protein